MTEEIYVRYGGREGKPWSLRTSERFVCVRTRNRAPLPVESLGATGRRALEASRTVVRYEEAGVEILDVGAPDVDRRDAVRSALRTTDRIEFAGRALIARDAPERTPIVYTENLFVKFAPEVKRPEIRSILARAKLVVKRALPWARNAFFTGAARGSGLGVFELAEELLASPAVELCHPEVIQPRAPKAAYPAQWHLDAAKIGGHRVDAHARVAKAWKLATGKGSCIALIDDGFDTTHPELGRRGKVVHPRDVTRDLSAALPFSPRDVHGTACAGVACASGRFGASGVAPDATLLPIRSAAQLGSMDEAEAFYWAAEKGADVISCSWGPADGRWWEPDDPAHLAWVPLPDSTRTAIDHAVTHGRGGRGCLVFFAAGNGQESVDLDGYASYERVLAVAACNDRSVRSVYSDFGRAVFCSFPSSDFEDAATGRTAPLTPGIWTTDRVGARGYNARGDYTDSFGGTSSACPGAAGVAALVLSANPALSRDEVVEVLRSTATKIDEAGGRYAADGRSPLYGYGRLDALAAVRAAMELVPRTRRIEALRRPTKPTIEVARRPRKAAARTTKKKRARR